MKKQIIKTMLVIAVLTAMTSGAWAAGTAAGTNIDNTASISYFVGSTGQPDIESSEGGNSTPGGGSPTTFVVDKKIDLLVTGATTTNVAPGETAAANNTELTFTLLNEGNSTEDFNLSTSQVAAGDEFDTSACLIISPASPVTLAADASIAVVVECDIPVAGVVNGDSSLVDLLAIADVPAETLGADTAGTVDIVYVDDTGTTTDGANRNAQHSAVSTYMINTANISVAKTSEVTEDPYNGTTNPKRIPGATIEYTITVENAVGAEAATGIVITDIIPSDLIYVSCFITAPSLVVTDCNIAGGIVTSGSFDLAPGEIGILTIVTTINDFQL